MNCAQCGYSGMAKTTGDDVAITVGCPDCGDVLLTEMRG